MHTDLAGFAHLSSPGIPSSGCLLAVTVSLPLFCRPSLIPEQERLRRTIPSCDSAAPAPKPPDQAHCNWLALFYFPGTRLGCNNSRWVCERKQQSARSRANGHAARQRQATSNTSTFGRNSGHGEEGMLP